MPRRRPAAAAARTGRAGHGSRAWSGAPCRAATGGRCSGRTVAQATHDRAIAFDDTSKDFLDNVELKKVLAEVKRQTGREFDVLGFDACLMNMIEVAYQLRGTAQVVVGSEELEPGEGWPYDRVLKTLAANPDDAPAPSSARTSSSCTSTRTGTRRHAVGVRPRRGSMRRPASIDALAKALTKAIKDATDYTAVAKTLNATQRFDTADFVDLGHFCRELSKRSKSAAVKSAAKATDEALRHATASCSPTAQGRGVSNASGAAIYFPRGPVNKAYAKLDFAKNDRLAQLPRRVPQGVRSGRGPGGCRPHESRKPVCATSLRQRYTAPGAGSNLIVR